MIRPALIWDKAVDILAARIRDRYIGTVDCLIATEENKPASKRRFGFAVLAIDCLLIETLSAFIEEASLGKTGCQGILLRGEVLFIEVDAKALNPLKTTSIHNAARMVESCATNPIRAGPARKPT